MKIFLMAFALFFIGCTSGNCRTQKNETASTAASAKPAESSDAGGSLMSNSTTSQDKVKVYRYDGSLQCGQGKAIPLNEMAKDLKGLKIFSSQSKPDNLMRTMVCGTPTGQANVYEIEKSKLSEAKKMGFKEWTFE